MSTTYTLDLLENLETKQNTTQDNELKPIIIYCTRDYDIFKRMPGNRAISQRHVTKLTQSIIKTDLLDCRPIIVDKNMVILDGQHRLEAAKKLGRPVYYYKRDDITFEDAALLNSCQDNWDSEEFLNFWISEEKEQYIKLNNFLKSNNLSLGKFYYIVSKEQKFFFDEYFKTGEFQITDDLNILESKLKNTNGVIGLLENLLVKDNLSFIYTENFWKGLINIVSLENFDLGRFIDKLSIKSNAIVKKQSYKDYSEILIDIYNWKSKKSRKKLDMDKI